MNEVILFSIYTPWDINLDNKINEINEELLENFYNSAKYTENQTCNLYHSEQNNSYKESEYKCKYEGYEQENSALNNKMSVSKKDEYNQEEPLFAAVPKDIIYVTYEAPGAYSEPWGFNAEIYSNSSDFINFFETQLVTREEFDEATQITEYIVDKDSLINDIYPSAEILEIIKNKREERS